MFSIVKSFPHSLSCVAHRATTAVILDRRMSSGSHLATGRPLIHSTVKPLFPVSVAQRYPFAAACSPDCGRRVRLVAHWWAVSLFIWCPQRAAPPGEFCNGACRSGGHCWSYFPGVMSLQLILRSGTRWNLRMSDLQMSCSDLNCDSRAPISHQCIS